MKAPGARKIAGRPGQVTADAEFGGRYFLCEPLAATISVAQCRANRARPVERGAGKVRGHLRPGPCADCALALELEAGEVATWTLAERIAQVRANGGAAEPPEPVEGNPWIAARESKATPARGEFHEEAPPKGEEPPAVAAETAQAEDQAAEPTVEEQTRFLEGPLPAELLRELRGPGPTARIKAVLEGGREIMTVAQIAALAEHDRRLTGILLVELGKKGRIERVGRGLYRGRGEKQPHPPAPSPPAAAREGERECEGAEISALEDYDQVKAEIILAGLAKKGRIERMGWGWEQGTRAGDTRSMGKVAKALRAGREQGTPAGDIGRCLGALREHLARCGDRPALEMLERIERMIG